MQKHYTFSEQDTEAARGLAVPPLPSKAEECGQFMAKLQPKDKVWLFENLAAVPSSGCILAA